MRHFVNKYSLEFLNKDGIGKMSDTTNGIPKNCIEIDLTEDE